MTRDNVLSIWTEGLVDTLKGLLAKGFSRAEIAAEVGVTRNAVCGKISRLQLNGGSPKTFTRRTAEQIEATKRAKMERRNERRRSQRVIVVRVKPVNLEALRCVEVIPQHKSLLDLDAGGCRYPYGDSNPYTFCNHAQIDGSSYCGPHMAITRRGMS